MSLFVKKYEELLFFASNIDSPIISRYWIQIVSMTIKILLEYPFVAWKCKWRCVKVFFIREKAQSGVYYRKTMKKRKMESDET